jgi:glycosyltransferase involved in cell wall biosynthesis
MATVSVVMPAYNAGRTIEVALRSVLDQERSPDEVLVVDDGSVDDTAARAESLGAPIKVLRQPNGGVSRARNLGISESVGDVVALLDADDAWKPSKLRRQMEVFESESSVGACFTGALRAGPDLEELESIPAVQHADFTHALLLGCVVSGSASSMAIRRSALDRVGPFDESLSQCADWDMWLRLSRVTAFKAIREPLVLYRTQPGSMSSNVGLLERDSTVMFDKFFESDPEPSYVRHRNRYYATNWSVLAGSYLAAGDRADALRCLWRVARLHPASLGRAVTLPLRRMQGRKASQR